jgi:hypothetical protein
MKIVLQDTKTHCFFGDSGEWTPDVKTAVDFGNSQRAIDFAKAHSLNQVIIMVAFVKGPYLESIALPIDSALPDPALSPGSQPSTRNRL